MGPTRRSHLVPHHGSTRSTRAAAGRRMHLPLPQPACGRRLGAILAGFVVGLWLESRDRREHAKLSPTPARPSHRRCRRWTLCRSASSTPTSAARRRRRRMRPAPRPPISRPRCGRCCSWLAVASPAAVHLFVGAAVHFVVRGLRYVYPTMPANVDLAVLCTITFPRSSRAAWSRRVNSRASPSSVFASSSRAPSLNSFVLPHQRLQLRTVGLPARAKATSCGRCSRARRRLRRDARWEWADALLRRRRPPRARTPRSVLASTRSINIFIELYHRRPYCLGLHILM